MSPSNLTVDIWPVTDAGQVEEQNEDYVLVYQPTDPQQAYYAGSLYVVVDGMGGGDKGALAARYTAEKIMHSYFNNTDPDLGYRLRLAIEQVNADLYDYAGQQTELLKLGASVTAAVVRGEQLHVAWVGNCRAYLIRDNVIIQLTRDHTLVQQLLEESAITPEEAQDHPRRDVVLRMLGGKPEVQVEVFDGRLKADDVMVLCSDGLTRVLHPDEIASIAGTSSPRNATTTMLQKANDRGSRDNITIVTALMRAGGPPLETDIPFTWDGNEPALDLGSGKTLVRRRVDVDDVPPPPPPPPMPEPPPDPGETVQRQRIRPEDLAEPVGTSLPPQQPAPPPEQAPPPEAQPAPPADQTVPAPPYQASVQPAPAYGAPQHQGPGVPRGYQPPPGYVVDPVTGLPPMPVEGGQQSAQPQGYQPRVYQTPGAPNAVQQPRQGVSVGMFAAVGVFAIILTILMVIMLINPWGWELPFGGAGADDEVAETQEPSGEQDGEAAGDATQPSAPATSATLEPATPAVQPTSAPVPPGMVLVDEGTFTRGISEEEIQEWVLNCIGESDTEGDPECRFEWFEDASPPEQIELSAFYMDVTEVTNLNYAACVAAEACSPPENQEFYADTAYAQHPVVYVTWVQATDYCSWAGKRLPTEAEWEKAARWDPASQTSLTFPWGDIWEAGRANTAAAGIGGTSAVQAFAQDLSPWGVLGMTGNVSEWVEDWYFPDYTGLGTLNPVRSGNQPLEQAERSVRGGWWGEELTAYVRAAHRLSAEFDRSGDWLGFRCAADVGATVTEPEATEAPTEEGTPAEGETPVGEGTATEEPTETPQP